MKATPPKKPIVARKRRTVSSAPISAATDEEAVCARLRALRTASGLTLEVLAERSGFTKGYLSKVENGRSIPPIASLARIARAMGRDLSYFFVDQESVAEPDRDPADALVSVVHHWERKPIVRGAAGFGYDYVSLAHKRADKCMEPFIFTFPSQVDINTYFEHPGEEFIHIMTGQVEFEIKVDGRLRRWTLEAGDSIYFESSLPHRGYSVSGDAQALVVVTGQE